MTTASGMTDASLAASIAVSCEQTKEWCRRAYQADQIRQTTAEALTTLGLKAPVSVDAIKKAVRALTHRSNQGSAATENFRKIVQSGAHLLEMAR